MKSETVSKHINDQYSRPFLLFIAAFIFRSIRKLIEIERSFPTHFRSLLFSKRRDLVLETNFETTSKE